MHVAFCTSICWRFPSKLLNSAVTLSICLDSPRGRAGLRDVVAQFLVLQALLVVLSPQRLQIRLASSDRLCLLSICADTSALRISSVRFSSMCTAAAFLLHGAAASVAASAF